MKAKPFFVAFFAVAVLLGAVSFYMSATIDKADTFIAAVNSPDGKYKAVKKTLSAGGASPFCIDSISILLTAYPGDYAERNKAYEVYSAACAAPDKRATLPKIEWRSPTAVTISYPAKPARPDDKQPKTKPLDVTKTVHVTFVAVE